MAINIVSYYDLVERFKSHDFLIRGDVCTFTDNGKIKLAIICNSYAGEYHPFSFDHSTDDFKRYIVYILDIDENGNKTWRRYAWLYRDDLVYVGSISSMQFTIFDICIKNKIAIPMSFYTFNSVLAIELNKLIGYIEE